MGVGLCVVWCWVVCRVWWRVCVVWLFGCDWVLFGCGWWLGIGGEELVSGVC